MLLHLAALERLSLEPGDLPPQMARALSEDIEYARLGAALPDLPLRAGLRGGLWFPSEAPHFSRIFHARAPVALGLKMAELVTNGALVGTYAGLALVSGYFTHLCLDRVLHSRIEIASERTRRAGESPWSARRRIEWALALVYLDDVFGKDMLGDPGLRRLFQVTKRHGLPVRGVGRGIYEVLRLSATFALRESPSKSDLDAWVRGLYLHGMALSSPLARLGTTWRGPVGLARSEGEVRAAQELRPLVADALEVARKVLDRLAAMIDRGRFSPRGRQRFLTDFPEVPTEPCAV